MHTVSTRHSDASSDAAAERSPYTGLRMAADEFLRIQDDGNFYELIDGVVVVSPSPSPRHQQVLLEILMQLVDYLRDHPVGMVFPESDVHLGASASGGDLVYRPEILFVSKERISEVIEPDLVVEVISRGSRRIDTQTKRDDYERFGVREYWLIDPDRETMSFRRLRGARYIEAPAGGDSFASEAVPGFVLDLARVRKTFEPW